MPKITIEIDDVLPDCVEWAINEVRDLLFNYFADNDGKETPSISELDDDGRVHDIVDGACPIYAVDVRAAWFLHGRDLQDSYEFLGIGDNAMDNDGKAAIYAYIHERVHSWYSNNADEVREQWLSNRSVSDD